MSITRLAARVVCIGALTGCGAAVDRHDRRTHDAKDHDGILADDSLLDGGSARALVKTSAPTGAPYLEDFTDGVADHFQPVAGAWTVQAMYGVKAYYTRSDLAATSPKLDEHAVSRVAFDGLLPAKLDVSTRVILPSQSPLAGGPRRVAYIAFDVVTDLKGLGYSFAGLAYGAQMAVFGQVTPDGREHILCAASMPVPLDKPIDLTLRLDGKRAILYAGTSAADFVPRSACDFPAAYAGGAVGLGATSSSAAFTSFKAGPSETTNAILNAVIGAATVPGARLFSLFAPRFGGVWPGTGTEPPMKVVSMANYWGLATLRSPRLGLEGHRKITIRAKVAARTGGSGGVNGFLVFALKDHLNFKYAGARVGAGTVVIGEVVNGVSYDRCTAPIKTLPSTDYALQVGLDSAARNTLLVMQDMAVLSCTKLSGPLYSGDLGVGTQLGVIAVKDFTVQDAAGK